MAKKGLKCGILGAFPPLSPDKQEVNHPRNLQQEKFFQGNLKV